MSVRRPARPERAAFAGELGELPYRRVVSKRMQLGLALPGRSGWKMRRERGSFLTFDHAATGSVLMISLWTGPELMNRQRCEERARLRRELPDRGEPVADRHAAVPAGFDTHSEISVSRSPEGVVQGQLLAFGASTRRCFAFAFKTQAAGSDAEADVGARLAAIDSIALDLIEERGTLGDL